MFEEICFQLAVNSAAYLQYNLRAAMKSNLLFAEAFVLLTIFSSTLGGNEI